MAKVTEQDLIDCGFKKEDGSYFKYYPHEILGMLELEVYENTIFIRQKNLNTTINLSDIYLTPANLDLFIRFAKGENIND